MMSIEQKKLREQGKKKCQVCLQIKPITEFHKRKGGNPRHSCKSCRIIERRQRYADNSEYEIEHRKQYYIDNPDKKEERRVHILEYSRIKYSSRREMVNNIKNNPCFDCGKVLLPEAMDFDHRDPSTKLFTISTQIASKNIDDLLSEINKCDLVCANCHRDRTHNRHATTTTDKFYRLIYAHKSVPCADCGIQYPPWSMDFDHIKGNKLFDISKPPKRDYDLIEAEIAKCDIICACCHRIRTFKDSKYKDK